MAAASNYDEITITVLDMAGKTYEITMNKNNTIFDIKHEIYKQHPEYVIPIQKLIYRPPKNAKIPNKIPYHPAYNNNSYNIENPYYILDNKQKISFWNFPDNVTLDLLIVSTEYNPKPFQLYFYILLFDVPELSHLSTQDSFIFSVKVIPGITFERIFKIICTIYHMDEASYKCTSRELPDEFTLYKIKKESAHLDLEDKIIYQKIRPTDIIDESYRIHPYLCIDDTRIKNMYKQTHTDPYSILRYSRPIHNADRIVQRIQYLRSMYSKLVEIQRNSGGYRRTRHRRRRNKRSHKCKH